MVQKRLGTTHILPLSSPQHDTGAKSTYGIRWLSGFKLTVNNHPWSPWLIQVYCLWGTNMPVRCKRCLSNSIVGILPVGMLLYVDGLIGKEYAHEFWLGSAVLCYSWVLSFQYKCRGFLFCPAWRPHEGRDQKQLWHSHVHKSCKDRQVLVHSSQWNLYMV